MTYWEDRLRTLCDDELRRCYTTERAVPKIAETLAGGYGREMLEALVSDYLERRKAEQIAFDADE